MLVDGTSGEKLGGPMQMAANGGLVGPREDGKTERTEEGLLPTPAVPAMKARHLRIVHSDDGGSLAHPLRVWRLPPGAQGSPASGGPPSSQGMLDRSIQARIGLLLRDAFAGVAGEPVPARFIELLEALAAQEEQPQEEQCEQERPQEERQ
jgi:hypothetical protein